MTLLDLPTELLAEICSRVSSPSELYHLLYTSKKLVNIVKPLLYHHIIITNKSQRDLIGNVNKEDAKLVKKLVIRGFESVDLSRRDEEDYDWEGEDRVRPGCVRDLLEGRLLDFSSLETLHVVNVEEEESEMRRETNDLSVKVASNLVELSISSHGGAEDLWHHVLRPEIVPTLRRLGFCSVTRYLYGFDGYDSDFDPYPEVSLCTRKVTIPSTVPFSQLEVLVVSHSATLAEIPNFPFSRALVLLDYTATSAAPELLELYQNVQLSSSWDHCLNEPRYRSMPLSNLRFLSLPPLYGKTLTEEAQEWLNQRKNDGVEVSWDGEQDWISTSIIPQHFVDFVGKKETLEIVEGKS